MTNHTSGSGTGGGRRGGKTPEYRLAAAIVAHIGLSDPEIGRNAVVAREFILDRLCGSPHSDELLGHELYASAQNLAAAAEAFFAAVMEREIEPVRGDPATAAHKLLTLRLASMSGEPAWSGAHLTDPPTGGGAIRSLDPRIRLLGGRLDALTALRGTGPGLAIANLVLGTPKRLTLWEALTLSPVAFLVPAEMSSRVGFLFLLTAALENADRHWLETIRAGLFPPGHWLDGATVNQLRSMNRFRKLLNEHGGVPDGIGKAWGESPVTGFKTPEALMANPIWRRSLHEGWKVGERHVADSGPLAGTYHPDHSDERERSATDACSDDEMTRRLNILRERGVIDDFDRWLFGELIAGRSFKELGRQKRVKDHLKATTHESIEAYASELLTRVAEHVETLDRDTDDDEESPNDQ